MYLFINVFQLFSYTFNLHNVLIIWSISICNHLVICKTYIDSILKFKYILFLCIKYVTYKANDIKSIDIIVFH